MSMILKFCLGITTILLFGTGFTQELPKVIVFSKTEGYRHKSIEEGVKSIIELGKENKFIVEVTENSDQLISSLKSCKAVIFLSTTGDVLDDKQQEKFKEFINNGGGFVGVHAATDTEYDWSWYGKMIGAYFESHPKQQNAKIDIVNHQHLATSFLDKEWTKFDEWYNFKNINPKIKIILNLNETSYEGGKNGKNHPIAWFHEFEGGKIFYTGLGHTKESYQDKTFLKHLLGGIQYVMGLGVSYDENKKWIRIFNGKDLSDWKVKIKGHPLGDNYKNTFRVVDECIQVNYDQYEVFNNAFGHLFYKNPYSDYRLRLQYRFTGEQVKGGEGWAERNSGVMLHCQPPESMTLDQNFPVCVEVQLLGGITVGVSRPTANVCTPGSHIVLNGEFTKTHCINSSSKTYYGEQWVNLEILVRNDSVISHIIDGKEVISYKKPVIGGEYNTLKSKEGVQLKSGYISLQSESHPVEFRNIELLKID